MYRERYPNDINLGTKSISRSNLNLLEALTGYTRNSLKVIFCRKELSLSNYHDVSRYIREWIAKHKKAEGCRQVKG